MEHYDVLNAILANTCVKEWREGDKKVFEIDLHCTVARVTATLISTVDTFQYEINGLEFV